MTDQKNPKGFDRRNPLKDGEFLPLPAFVTRTTLKEILEKIEEKKTPPALPLE